MILMALFSIMRSLLASCGDIELNPGPGLSECVPVYTQSYLLLYLHLSLPSLLLTYLLPLLLG